MTEHVEIVPLSPRRIGEAAAVLARAFHNDPGFARLLPQESTRADALRRLARGCLRYSHLYGEAHATTDLRGLAVWLTPTSPPARLWRLFRAGLLTVPAGLRHTPFGQLIDAIRHMGTLHSRDSAEPHRYLWFLGVEPEHQGRGLGSALLRATLARADAARTPCLLETFDPRNLRFYRRHGFEVVEEGDMAPQGPHYWRMKRPPGAQEDTRR